MRSLQLNEFCAIASNQEIPDNYNYKIFNIIQFTFAGGFAISKRMSSVYSKFSMNNEEFGNVSNQMSTCLESIRAGKIVESKCKHQSVLPSQKVPFTLKSISFIYFYQNMKRMKSFCKFSL